MSAAEVDQKDEGGGFTSGNPLTFTEADEAKERSKMSKSDKAKIKADMYGQVHPDETPELVASTLVKLEAELEKLPDEAKIGYGKAMVRCPNLVQEKQKLMFLRCEVFNVDLAALRLVKYWDKRIEIFGEDRAFLPLTLEGALKDDVDALLIGFIRTHETMKDKTGRRVMFADPSVLDHEKYERKSMCRATWYVVHAALEDEMTQKRGVVMLGYPHRAKLTQFDRGLVTMNMESIRGCIPVRVGAFHICQPPVFFKIVFPIFKFLMGARLRARIKVHSGSEEYVLKRLNKYGIEKDSTPSELGGNLVLDQRVWVEDRRAAGL